MNRIYMKWLLELSNQEYFSVGKLMLEINKYNNKGVGNNENKNKSNTTRG